MLKRARETSAATHLELAGFPYGTRPMVYDARYEAWYLGEVVDATETKVKIRFSGWLEDNDEWLNKASDRFDFSNGGRKKWRTIRGAVGAYQRVPHSGAPTGKLLDRLPSGCSPQSKSFDAGRVSVTSSDSTCHDQQNGMATAEQSASQRSDPQPQPSPITPPQTSSQQRLSQQQASSMRQQPTLLPQSLKMKRWCLPNSAVATRRDRAAVPSSRKTPTTSCPETAPSPARYEADVVAAATAGAAATRVSECLFQHPVASGTLQQMPVATGGEAAQLTGTPPADRPAMAAAKQAPSARPAAVATTAAVHDTCRDKPTTATMTRHDITVAAEPQPSCCEADAESQSSAFANCMNAGAVTQNMDEPMQLLRALSAPCLPQPHSDGDASTASQQVLAPPATAMTAAPLGRSMAELSAAAAAAALPTLATSGLPPAAVVMPGSAAAAGAKELRDRRHGATPSGTGLATSTMPACPALPNSAAATSTAARSGCTRPTVPLTGTAAVGCAASVVVKPEAVTETGADEPAAPSSSAQQPRPLLLEAAAERAGMSQGCPVSSKPLMTMMVPEEAGVGGSSKDRRLRWRKLRLPRRRWHASSPQDALSLAASTAADAGTDMFKFWTELSQPQACRAPGHSRAGRQLLRHLGLVLRQHSSDIPCSSVSSAGASQGGRLPLLPVPQSGAGLPAGSSELQGGASNGPLLPRSRRPSERALAAAEGQRRRQCSVVDVEQAQPNGQVLPSGQQQQQQPPWCVAGAGEHALPVPPEDNGTQIGQGTSDAHTGLVQQLHRLDTEVKVATLAQQMAQQELAASQTVAAASHEAAARLLEFALQQQAELSSAAAELAVLRKQVSCLPYTSSPFISHAPPLTPSPAASHSTMHVQSLEHTVQSLQGRWDSLGQAIQNVRQQNPCLWEQLMKALPAATAAALLAKGPSQSNSVGGAPSNTDTAALVASISALKERMRMLMARGAECSSLSAGIREVTAAMAHKQVQLAVDRSSWSAILPHQPVEDMDVLELKETMLVELPMGALVVYPLCSGGTPTSEGATKSSGDNSMAPEQPAGNQTRQLPPPSRLGRLADCLVTRRPETSPPVLLPPAPLPSPTFPQCQQRSDGLDTAPQVPCLSQRCAALSSAAGQAGVPPRRHSQPSPAGATQHMPAVLNRPAGAQEGQLQMRPAQMGMHSSHQAQQPQPPMPASQPLFESGAIVPTSQPARQHPFMAAQPAPKVLAPPQALHTERKHQLRYIQKQCPRVTDAYERSAGSMAQEQRIPISRPPASGSPTHLAGRTRDGGNGAFGSGSTASRSEWHAASNANRVLLLGGTVDGTHRLPAAYPETKAAMLTNQPITQALVHASTVNVAAMNG